ncbi:unnamed protein product, partial [marine sediment metagenome]
WKKETGFGILYEIIGFVTALYPLKVANPPRNAIETPTNIFIA